MSSNRKQLNINCQQLLSLICFDCNYHLNQVFLLYLNMKRSDFPWNQNYMESPITGKYYIQFNNNYLIDIIKHAVRDIIFYDATLPQLVISELQKEIFLIYDNTNIKSNEVENLIRQEFRIATKFQKKLLDMTYVQMEKDKDSISDMRQEGNPWLQSFRLYKMEASELSRKTYGIIASMFLNSFVKICKALNKVANLVNLLIQQSILPPLKMEDMSQRFVNLILTEFNESPFQAGGPSISNVIACMTQEFKKTFVTCHNKGQDIRRRFCRYDSHVESALMDLFVEPQIAFAPMFELKQQSFIVPQKKLQMSNMMDSMVCGSYESDFLKKITLKKAEEKEYKMLRQFARFWKGYDENQDDQDAIYEQLKRKHEEFLRYLDQKQKERAEKPRLQNQIQLKTPAQIQKELISQKLLNINLIQSKQSDSSKSLSRGEGKQRQENKVIQTLPKSLKTQNQVVSSKKQQKTEKQQSQHQIKLLKIPQSQPAQATFTQKSSQKHSKIQICSKSIQITNQPTKQQNKQTSKPILNNQKIHGICRQHKLAKKAGKQLSNKQKDQLKIKQIIQMSTIQTTSKYEYDENIIKLRLTKDELRKLEKKKQLAQIGRIPTNQLNTRQFKLVSQTNYNNEQISKYYFQSDNSKTKVQIRNTIFKPEVWENQRFGHGIIEKFAKYKMIECSDDEDQLYTTFSSQSVSEKASTINQLFKNDEEKDSEAQQNKKKKKNKNKKKKNKKAEQCDVSEIKLQKNISSVSSHKQECAAIVQKSQQEKNLLSFMENLRIDDKDRSQCFLSDQYLKKWRIKMQKWKSNLSS